MIVFQAIWRELRVFGWRELRIFGAKCMVNPMPSRHYPARRQGQTRRRR